MKDFRAEAFSTIRGRCDDLLEMVQATDKFAGEQVERLDKEVNAVRTIATSNLKA